MEKSKYTQYVLVGLVLIIWGTIIYKFVDVEKSESYNFSKPIENLSLTNITTLQKDSFKLMLDYPNPFGASNLSIGQKSKSAKVFSKKTKTPPLPFGKKVKTPKMPFIEYLGISKDQMAQQKVRLKINQFSYTVRESEKVEGIQVQQIHRDSIVVIWRGVRKIIKKSQYQKIKCNSNSPCPSLSK